ncbi:retrovirus-related pol polyprotein from transposon TNT 1-94 [Tanacetum coccineum]
MHDDVQPNYVVESHADYTSDSNMIPYDQYVKDNTVPVVQSNVSSVPNDAYMMMLNDIYEPSAKCVSVTTQNNVIDNSLIAELVTYKEQVELYLVRGLPKLKFEKDHLCSSCVMGKSKKKPHKPKSEDTNQEKLYLLHMDLCGPMRVASINGKKYILVIVYDYSRFTWVKCLRSKDKAPYFITKFLKMIQVRLKEPV